MRIWARKSSPPVSANGASISASGVLSTDARAANQAGEVTARNLESYVKRKIADLGGDQEPQFLVESNVVLASGLAPPRSTVVVTLAPGTPAFEVRDGQDLMTVLDVTRKKTGAREWRIELPPGGLYVIAVPNAAGWFDRSVPVETKDEAQDVTL